MKKKILWLIPEKNPGGIHSYSQILHEGIARHPQEEWEILPPIIDEMGERSRVEAAVRTIADWKPDLLHVQHEYGCFGRKLPYLYTFPTLLEDVREASPSTKVICTAHGVLPLDAKYPWKGMGYEAVFRVLANALFIKGLRKLWNEETWGGIDGVIVHSKLQEEAIRSSGCPKVATIPHFVPHSKYMDLEDSSGGNTILVFGYFTPDKGQDVVIAALRKLHETEHGKKFRLIFAGGVRREEDLSYFNRCRMDIHQSGLADSVEVTGFVQESEIDGIYARSALVVTPFRSTTGSGSLVYALARGAPILASDLSLNLEIAERESQCLSFFKSEDPDDLALRIQEVFSDPGKRKALKSAARRYAERHTLSKIVQAHFSFYRDVLK